MARPVNAARRAELLDAIVDYLVEHGVADLSLRPLAAATGVTPTTLVHHFGTKEELLGEALNGVRRRIMQALAPAAGRGASDGALLWEAWRWTSADEHLPLFRVFFDIYGRALHDPARFGAFMDHVVDDWLTALGAQFESAGAPPATARAKATLGVALIRGLLLDLLTTGDRDRVEAALAAHTAERGLRG